MKTEKNILIAFILNLTFSVLEFIGGFFTGSVAIISDALHDLGDSLSIGLSYFLEKKSKKAPDSKYTYGYGRYSLLGSVITTLILMLGSIIVISNAINRILNPVEINHNGMILFALFGILINSVAALFTHGGDSLNQKAVNLHMLEDVLGWVIVFVGAVIIRFTSISLIDPIMSVGVSVFIFLNAAKNMKKVLFLFLEKVPEDINIEEIKEHISHIDGVIDVHHIHIRSMDGYNNIATMHVVMRGDFAKIKEKIRNELSEHGISHATIETERENESCKQKHCHIGLNSHHHHHHHHHH